MTKTKSTKRALLTSALALIMCISMLVGSTFAWFTDSVVSGSNVITAGNLDIEVQYTLDGKNWKDLDGANDLFQKGLWEPGHTEVVALKISNEGSLALKYVANMNIISETVGTNKAGQDIVLSDILTVSTMIQQTGVIGDYYIDSVFGSENAFYTNTATFKATNILGAENMLEPNTAHYVAIKVDMAETVGNEANAKDKESVPSINFGINVLATQYTSESDSFGNQYDASSFVTTDDELRAAIVDSKIKQIVVIGDLTYDWGGKSYENSEALYMKGKTIIGSDSNSSITFKGYGSANPITDVTLKNITVKDLTVGDNETSWEHGYLEFVSLKADDVVFADSIMLDGNSTLTNCSMINNVPSWYGIWIEGGNTVIKNCVFSGTRSIKVHEAYNGDVESVVVDNCVIGALSEKPGVVIGDLDATTKVTIKNSTFVNCQAGDQGMYIYESDTDVSNFNFVNENNTVAAKTTVSSATDLVNAFNSDATSISVEITDDIDLTEVLNVKQGKEVYLDMNGKTITVESGSSVDPAFYTYKDSTLVIDGNGTVILEDPSMSLIFPGGDVVIENGTFIRKVPAGTPANKVGALIVGAKVSPWGSQTVTINGGYFDGGYYDANAADIDDIPAGKKTLAETDADKANRGKSSDKNLVRVAIKNNTQLTLNLSYNLFKIYGGTFVGVNPAWGDEGCMLPAKDDIYLRPWSYYQGALLDGQEYNENGIVLPDGYNITKGATADGRPTYTVNYSK